MNDGSANREPVLKSQDDTIELELVPSGEFISVDGINVHLVTRGTGSPVVFIHGNSGSHLDFPDELIEAVAADFRTIAIDRPGHGFSERPEDRVLTVEDQAEILHGVIRQLDAYKPLIVGHSWGGSLALAYALAYPEDYSGAVLLAPYAFGSEAAQSSLDFFLGATIPTLPVVGDVAIRLLTPLIGEWMIEQGLRDAFHPMTVPVEYLESAKRLWTRPAQVRAYAEDEKTIDESLSKLSGRFDVIRRPLVIVAGEQDAMVSHEDHAIRLHNTVSGSKLNLLPEAGHQLPQTHPAVVIQAIRLVWEMVEAERNGEKEERESRQMEV
jgi:pimeloyl-ACP methyl ester carboxylesterase